MSEGKTKAGLPFKKDRVRYAEGDAIKGERIAVEARKIERKGVTRGSGKHEIQKAVLERNAYCVITKPLVKLPSREK